MARPFMTEIVQVHTQQQLQAVREMFQEYHSELPPQIRTLHFDQELETLPGKYALPHGALLLASVGGEPAGCVGLRPFPEVEQACEMKRLYVRPAFRGDKLGILLVQQIIDEARERRYARLRLDTHPPTMQSAVALYRRFNFVVVSEVTNPVPELVYMELKL
jgi:GNAT superfamily N-acetyltransferase